MEIDANRLGLPEKTRMACARIEGDHNILRRLEMHDANGTGVWMFGDPYLTVGEAQPGFYEAEWMPHCVLRPEGNWKRPIDPDRGSEGLLVTVEEPWDGSDPLQRESPGSNRRVAQYISNEKAEDGTWRLPLPVRSDGGECWFALLGSTPAPGAVYLRVDGERHDLSLGSEMAWSEAVKLDPDAGEHTLEIVASEAGVTLDQLYLSEKRPDINGSAPQMPISLVSYTTSHNIIEQCEMYYCCRLWGKNPNYPEDRESTICPTKTGEGNIIRLCRIHHTGADAIQPRRGANGMLIEFNELHGNSEDGIDLKSVTNATVRYNFIHSNRGGGLVSHDGHHPDPPMYAMGSEIYGNIIAGVSRFGVLINDAMRVYGDGRDTVSVHDNLLVAPAAQCVSINWARAPVAVERNTVVGQRPVVLGGRHSKLSPKGARARRFNEHLTIRDNVFTATDSALPLLQATFRHPEDTLPTFMHNVLAPGEGLAARTTRGLLLGHGVPDDWLQFEARDADLKTSSDEIVLKSHGSGFMVYESNHVGDYLQMPFELQEPVTGGVFVDLHKYGNRGVLRAYLDGERAGGEWDCYLPRPNSEFLRASLGDHTLEAGHHTVRVEVAGKHPGNPTAWIALYGLSIRPADATEIEPPEIPEYPFSDWNALEAHYAGVDENTIADISFVDPETLDHRLKNAQLRSKYGANWSEHLSWLTAEQIERFHDPDAGFEADHFIWDYSQVEEK